MAALGFDPIFAAIISLSYAVGLQLIVLIILVPLVLIMLTGKSIKAVKGVIGISLMSGLSFAAPEVLAAKYMGAELPALLGAVICMAVTILIAKVFYKETAKKDKEKIKKSEGILA